MSVSHIILKKIIKIQEPVNNQLQLSAVIVQYLRYIQSWPDNNKLLKNTIRFILVFIHSNITIAGIFGHCIHYFLTNPNPQFSESAMDIALISTCFAAYQYMFTFYFRQHRIKRLLNEMGDFREFEKPSDIEISDAILNIICKVVYVSSIAIAIVLFPTTLVKSCPDVESVEGYVDYSCGLVYPHYLPGITSVKQRKVYLFLHITSCTGAIMLGFGCLWFFVQMSQFIVLYLRHTQKMIKRVKNTTIWRQRRILAIHAVKYHQHLIGLYNEFAILSKNAFLIYAIWIPFALAIMTYTLIEHFYIMYFVLFSMWTISLFVACYIGQQMIKESEEIGNVAFDAIPFDGDKQTAQILFMVIVRSQKALFIPAGNITFCGHQLFLSVINSIYSFMALLRTANAK